MHTLTQITHQHWAHTCLCWVHRLIHTHINCHTYICSHTHLQCTSAHPHTHSLTQHHTLSFTHTHGHIHLAYVHMHNSHSDTWMQCLCFLWTFLESVRHFVISSSVDAFTLGAQLGQGCPQGPADTGRSLGQERFARFSLLCPVWRTITSLVFLRPTEGLQVDSPWLVEPLWPGLLTLRS